MKENMLDVLMYLFEHYMNDDTQLEPDQRILRNQLTEAGFPTQEISKAFDWLERLTEQAATKGLTSPPRAGSVRIYSSFECSRLSQQCRGYLHFLEQTEILTPALREQVIDRALALDPEEIDVDKLKWVILMVLFNQSERPPSLAWIEEFILNEPASIAH